MSVENRFVSVTDFIAALSSTSHVTSVALSAPDRDEIDWRSSRFTPTRSPARAPSLPSIATSFGEGTWRVGVDIAPGTYRTPGNKEFAMCAVLRNFTGKNEEISHAYSQSGPCIVTIDPTAVGIRCTGSAIWTKID